MMIFKKQKSSGFTLMEMIITVAILAILAVFAIASYRHYITKARLREGQSALQTNYLHLETIYSKNNRYGSKDASGNFQPILSSNLKPSSTGAGNAGYDISVHPTCNSSDDGTTETTFCLKATPRSGQAAATGGGRECGVLTVDQTGKFEAKGDTNNEHECFKH